MKLSLICLLLSGLVVVLAELRVPQQGVIFEVKKGVAGPNPYIFLSVPDGRSQSIVRGFEVVEDDEIEDAEEDVHAKPNSSLDNKESHDDDDDDDDHDDDNDADDDNNDDVEEEEVVAATEDDDEGQYANDDEDDMDAEVNNNSRVHMLKTENNKNANAPKKNAAASQAFVSRDQAGTILIPDEIIEVEGQSVIDQKTGRQGILLPRAVLDSIPDGSVVALLEQPTEPIAEERANRVIVRRRRKGSRRNVKRRRVNGNKNLRRRMQGANKRRRGNNNGIRVMRINGNRNRNRNAGLRANRLRNNRRDGNRRRVIYQH